MWRIVVGVEGACLPLSIYCWRQTIGETIKISDDFYQDIYLAFLCKN